MTMKILIVEDEIKTGEYLRQGLREAGFAVDLAHDGLEGLHLALEGGHDLLILDVMLPGMDGWQVLTRLRLQHKTMPVLFLTARDQVEDRVKGLELGADDYLVKPFSFAELLARVRTILRRGRGTVEATTLQIAGLELDLLRAGAADAPPGRGIAAQPDSLAGVGHEFRQRYQCDRRRRAPAAGKGR